MKRSNPWLTAALQTVLLLAVVAFATPWLEARELTLQALPTLRRSEDVGLRTSSPRPVYNGSVVPGGVYAADELRAAMAHDPVVAGHYRAAAVNALRPVTLRVGRAAYVSYRVNDEVYWTSKRVWIRAGETVLTDGTTMVRARCGNCISDRREGPVAAVDPAHGELDDFVVPPDADRSVDGLAAEDSLGDLLEVPFGPQVFAAATPAWATVNDDTPFGDVFPMSSGPGIVLPGPGTPGTPTAVFVPPGGGTTTTTSGTTDTTDGSPGGGTTSTSGAGTSGSPGGVTTATPGGGATTGTPFGTTTGVSATTTGTTSGSSTGGVPADDTSTTGFPSCCSTGSPGGTTDGSPTSGHPFDTTATVTTVSTSPSPHDAPEPDVAWLVACAVIGLASRKWRGR